MLQKAVGVNSYVIYNCHEFLMEAFDKMLFRYMVLKGEDSFFNLHLGFGLPRNLYQYTHNTNYTPYPEHSLVHLKNVPGTDAVVNIGVHLPQHTAQRTRQADPESCGQETLHDEAGRGTHETHSGITRTNLNLLLTAPCSTIIK